MNDSLSRQKFHLVGFLWSETKNIAFDSVFCPFSKRAEIPYMFKCQDKLVISADILLSNFRKSKAIIENNNVTLDQSEILTFTETKMKNLNIIENLATQYGLTSEEGAWLDNIYNNINVIQCEYKKTLAFYIANAVIRYITSFDEISKSIKIEEDLNYIFNYYADAFNQKIYSNNQKCESFKEDANIFIKNIKTYAMYLYPPSAEGFTKLNKVEYLIELFNNYVPEEELGQILTQTANNITGLGKEFKTVSDYEIAFDEFLSNAAHIPVWIISYNQGGILTTDKIFELISKYKKNIISSKKELFHFVDETFTEYLFIATA